MCTIIEKNSIKSVNQKVDLKKTHTGTIFVENIFLIQVFKVASDKAFGEKIVMFWENVFMDIIFRKYKQKTIRWEWMKSMKNRQD